MSTANGSKDRSIPSRAVQPNTATGVRPKRALFQVEVTNSRPKELAGASARLNRRAASVVRHHRPVPTVCGYAAGAGRTPIWISMVATSQYADSRTMAPLRIS